MEFSETIEMITRTYMNIKGQSHSLTLVRGHSDSNLFFLKTVSPIEAKFMLRLHGMGERKFDQTV